MNDTGYVKTYRQMRSWEWYKKPYTSHLFMHLILSANFTESTFQGEKIMRGQLASSLTRLSYETGLTQQQVRTALNHLQSTGEITYRSNRRYSVITVVKYEEFQEATHSSTRTSTHSSTHSATQTSTPDQHTEQQADQHADQQQYKNIKNIKKKEIKNEKNNSLSADAEEGGRYFDLFWEAYPKKLSKMEAMKAWKKLKPDSDPEMLMALMNGLTLWKASPEWHRDGGRYIPHASTWLNNHRWEDELTKGEDSGSAPPVRQAPAKKVIAQNYEQRPYDDVQAQIEAERDRDMEEWLRSRGGA